MSPRITLVVALLLGCGSAGALEFAPGLWEIKTVMRSPMMGERNDTRTECVKDGDYDPIKDFEQQGDCQVLDQEETGDSLRWRMQCGPSDGPKMIGDGEFRSSGKTATGAMTMTMSFAGQSLVITNNWTGRHLGACP